MDMNHIIETIIMMTGLIARFTFIALILLSLNTHTLILYCMSLRIVGINVNGYSSSEPYIKDLLGRFDIVCISEHWLSGPELPRLNHICDNVISKCAHDLTDAPPAIGRGYGGVAIMWNSGVIAS